MKPRRQASSRISDSRTYSNFHRYDMTLIILTLFMVGLGLVMVASASVSVADRNYFDPLHYFWRQGFAAVLGLCISFAVIHTPLAIWQQGSVALLIIGLFLLVLVLIPGVGREVNGSMRWISIGPFNMQSSEPVKLCVIAYMAGYLVRHREKVMSSFAGFIRPIGVVTLVAGLLAVTISLVNIKDFFWFKRGVSLSITPTAFQCIFSYNGSYTARAANCF